MITLSIDFETRSRINLIKQGAYVYAYDDSTEPICCSFKRSDENVVHTWVPPWVQKATGYTNFEDYGLINVEDLLFADDIDYYVAWNAQFDRLIASACVDLHGWPERFADVDRWLCTAALSRTNGLPGKLENAARCLGITQQKDHRGRELIKLLSIPQADGTFNEDPDLIREMLAYCEQDVRTEHGCSTVFRNFLPHELEEYHYAERVNDYGIAIDADFCALAVRYSKAEMALLESELQEITDGVIERPRQYQRIKKWLLEGYEFDDENNVQRKTVGPTRVSRRVIKEMTVYKNGEKKLSLDKTIRNNLFTLLDGDPTLMTDDAADVLYLTDLAGRSTTAKYQTLLDRSIDGEYCGAYMFCGAPGSGRFSSTGVQIHNLMRECVDDFDEAAKKLAEQDDAEAIHTLSKMIRPTFIAAPGTKLYWSDWSNIEGRGLPWLAGTRTAQKKLDLFVHCDNHPDEPDVYQRTATGFGIDDRQMGKVIELSFGFGGGVGAGQAMARNYGVKIPDHDMLEGRDFWRRENSWAKPFWEALKNAAWSAIKRPEEMFDAGRVRYFYTPETHNGKGTLWCQLPSGRLLAYVEPRIEKVTTPWDKDETMMELTAIKANLLPKQGEDTWPRHKLWYGLLAENVTQAMCADLLRAAIVRIQKAGLTVVGHTHDEIIVESSEASTMEKLPQLMMTPPEWATGLPIVADVHCGLRYSK